MSPPHPLAPTPSRRRAQALSALTLARGAGVAAALAPLLAVAGGALAAPGTLHSTPHYDLRVEGPADAPDLGALLEALHARLAGWLGRAPAGRLGIEVYPDAERWRAALAAEGLGDPGGGGYYCPATRKAYLFLQPSEQYTRQLLLHEATHQFHYLAATGNRDPEPAWYREGLAEYFAMHDWDGTTLRTGVVPAISLEDYPAKAARALEERADLAALVLGRAPCGRAEAWALVRFLAERRGEAFRALARALDAGTPVAEAWAAALGGPPAPALLDEARAFTAASPQPWRDVWVAWQPRGGWIEGRSPVTALALLKRPPPGRLEVEVDVLEGEPKAGLIFGFRSTDDFWELQALAGRGARVVRRRAGAWTVVVPRVECPAAPAKGPRRLAVAPAGPGRVALEADGTPLGPFEAAGDVGVHTDGCRARFRLAAGN